jgi:hypothetical protein
MYAVIGARVCADLILVNRTNECLDIERQQSNMDAGNTYKEPLIDFL